MTIRPSARPPLLILAILVGGCAARTVPASAPPQAPATIEKPAAGSVAPTATPPSLPAPKGPLGALDQLFLDAYQAVSVTAKAVPHPVVVVSGSSLVLHLPRQKEQSTRVIPDLYHALKAVAHFAFAAYLRVKSATSAPPDSSSGLVLKELLAREPAARKHLVEFGLDAQQMTRQQAILDATTGLLREALSSSPITSARLQEYAKQMGPLLLENTSDGGCLQVEATHRQMMKWKAAHPQEDWNRVVVVNRSAHQARYRNAATTYFHWLLGGTAPSWSYPGESMRVIYGESLFGGDQALDLFATVVIDAQASRDFFGDEWRLSEDVLSEGASLCVAKLPPAERWIR